MREDGCGGTGYFECYCAGDFCACSLMGEVQCLGCDDCIDDDYDEDDMRL